MNSQYLNEVPHISVVSVITVLCFLTFSPSLFGMVIGGQEQNTFIQISESVSSLSHSSLLPDFHFSDISFQNHEEAHGPQKIYEAIAGVPINCSRTLPPGARALMRSIALSKVDKSISNQQQKGGKKLKIPDEYLHNCLRAYPYNVAQFPIGFTNRRIDIWYQSTSTYDNLFFLSIIHK